MDTPVIDAPEAIATLPKTPASSKKKATGEPAVDLFAAARYAKKMRRKKAHRAALRGSHTNG
jgi:hypothetical protein